MTTSDGHVLSQEILGHCRERGPMYDQGNRFFSEDFEEIRAAGYLKLAVPKELDGLGKTLAQGRLGDMPTGLQCGTYSPWH